MKKIASLVLGLVMIASVTTTAFAADTSGSTLYQFVRDEGYKDIAYVEVTKDNRFDCQIYGQGAGYIAIPDGSETKAVGGELKAVNPETLKKDIKTSVSEGVYIVGVDIAPGGTYRLEVIDESLAGSSYAMTLNSVDADLNGHINDVVITSESVTFTVDEGDYAIKLVNLQATRIN